MPSTRSASSQSEKSRSRRDQASLDPEDLTEAGVELDAAHTGT
jgi:hypothetical protein